MGNSILVSVIIPVYNVQQFLPEALESAINQTYENLEIVIVDDGSTDGSGILCDEYAKKDNRIIVIHQENMGLSAARNAGLNICTGEVIAFLDSDDAYQITFVETMLNVMKRTRSDIVICRHSIHSTKEKLDGYVIERVVPDAKKGVYDRNSALCALVDGHINHGVWNKLYNRKLWDNIRFPTGHVYEEIDTTYRIIDLCERVCIIDDLLYMYRRRPGSITSLYTAKNVRDYFLAQDHFESFIKENTHSIFSQEQLAKIKEYRLYQMVIFYCRLIYINGDEEKQCCDELSNEIKQIGCRIEIDNSDYLIKMCYWMICYCPKLLKVVCSLYYLFHHFHKNRLIVTQSK